LAITAQQVQELRRQTGAGVMDCKRALEESGGDIEKAVTALRKQGVARAEGRLSRSATEGVVASYIHAGGKIGVLVELNCETDFVARTDEFQALARNLAMHIAAEQPRFLTQEDVPEEVLENEREVYKAVAVKEGRPEKVLDRIVEGRLKKFYSEACLTEQPYVRDDEKTVGEVIKEAVAQMGENIVLRRFVRYQLGEGGGD
jgi:elongation factor Ts